MSERAPAASVEYITSRHLPFLEHLNLHAEWEATAHLDVNAVYVHFRTVGFLAPARAKNIDYLGLWTSCKF